LTKLSFGLECCFMRARGNWQKRIGILRMWGRFENLKVLFVSADFFQKNFFMPCLKGFWEESFDDILWVWCSKEILRRKLFFCFNISILSLETSQRFFLVWDSPKMKQKDWKCLRSLGFLIKSSWFLLKEGFKFSDWRFIG